MCQTTVFSQQTIIVIRTAVLHAGLHILQNMQKIIPLPGELGGGVVKAGNAAHRYLLVRLNKNICYTLCKNGEFYPLFLFSAKNLCLQSEMPCDKIKEI